MLCLAAGPYVLGFCMESRDLGSIISDLQGHFNMEFISPATHIIELCGLMTHALVICDFCGLYDDECICMYSLVPVAWVRG